MKILLYISLVSCRDCSNVTSESQDIKKKKFKNSLGYGGLWCLPLCWSPTSQGRLSSICMVHKWRWCWAYCCCYNTSGSLYPSGENCYLVRGERPCLAVEDKGAWAVPMQWSTRSLCQPCFLLCQMERVITPTLGVAVRMKIRLCTSLYPDSWHLADDASNGPSRRVPAHALTHGADGLAGFPSTGLSRGPLSMTSSTGSLCWCSCPWRLPPVTWSYWPTWWWSPSISRVEKTPQHFWKSSRILSQRKLSR